MGSEPMLFPLADVIGTITGVLLGQIDGIYKVSEFMIGSPVWTHQLPRVGREIQPVVLRQHPQLAPVIAEAKEVNGDNWHDMLAGWTARFGTELHLAPMGADEQTPIINPLTELVEMVGSERVVVVTTPTDRAP